MKEVVFAPGKSYEKTIVVLEEGEAAILDKIGDAIRAEERGAIISLINDVVSQTDCKHCCCVAMGKVTALIKARA